MFVWGIPLHKVLLILFRKLNIYFQPIDYQIKLLPYCFWDQINF